jgi:hypothetical protein
MRSEPVSTPHADEVGVFPTGRFEEAGRLEVHVDSVDVEMWGRLPFGVEIRLRAQKTLVVGGAQHHRNAGWRVEGIKRAVTLQNVHPGRHGEVERRLDGH